MSIAASTNLRVMSLSSESSSSTCGVIGSSAIPHLGQVPGPSRTTSGCIGQVYFTPGLAAAGVARECAPPQHECVCVGGPETKRPGSARNWSRQWRLQK